MPAFVSARNIAEVQLSGEVEKQVRDFVAEIASMYNENPCKFETDNILPTASCDGSFRRRQH